MKEYEKLACEFLKDRSDICEPVTDDFHDGLLIGYSAGFQRAREMALKLWEDEDMEKTFKEFVRKLHNDYDEWQIKELKDLKL